MSYLNPTPLLVPSTPDPSIVALVLPVLRYTVTFLVAVGFLKGPYSDTVLGAGAYALTGAGMAIWALIEKVKMARHTHATAVLNADRPLGGAPVQPV